MNNNNNKAIESMFNCSILKLITCLWMETSFYHRVKKDTSFYFTALLFLTIATMLLQLRMAVFAHNSFMSSGQIILITNTVILCIILSTFIITVLHVHIY